MNDIERQIFAATFAAAFYETWVSVRNNKGIKEAVNRVQKGFDFAEVADEAVKSYRNAMTCEDAKYLLAVEENWD